MFSIFHYHSYSEWNQLEGMVLESWSEVPTPVAVEAAQAHLDPASWLFSSRFSV